MAVPSVLIGRGVNTASQCWQHEGFGPVVGNGPCPGDRGGFDFTLQFEQSILSIGPSALLLLAVPLRWLQLRSESRKTKRGEILGFSKIGCIVGFGILQLVLVVLWATTQRPDRPFAQVTIAANTLGILDAMALGVLSFVEHRQSIRPSTLISLYLLFSLAFDAVQCRTLWLLPSGQRIHAIAAIFSIGIAFKAAILVLELKEKRSLLAPPWNRAPPESLSGAINRSLYWWINVLFSRGYKGILNLESLWPTDHDLASKKLLERFSSDWDKIPDKKKKNALAFSVLNSIKWPLVEMVIPRLILIGFRFSQPLLLTSIVNFISKPASPERSNTGYGLIGATALCYFGSGITQAVFGYKNIRARTMTRGILVSMVLSKSVTVSAAVSAQKGSSTLTLMGADVERIEQGFTVVNDAWAAPIEVAIAMWLLQRQLGVAFIVPGVLAVACTLIIAKITPLTGKAFAKWNQAVQERVSFTSAVLGNMKEVKLLGLTNRWSADIRGYRVAELERSKNARIFTVYRLTLMQVSVYLTPAATFGVFLLIARKSGEHLSISTAFTSLALLSLLANPLAYLFASLPQCSMALACFSRIQAFLAEADKEDSTPSGKSVSPLTSGVELETLTPSLVQRLGKATPILILNDASFGVKDEGVPITYGLNMEIHRSTLTIVIGKVGSGKSTLLQGILRELPSSTGSTQSIFTESAYCEQQPWLVNDTIQNNILGQSTLEARWYETVVAACALDKDFAALPQGGLSLIGSKGISLSGGQKARVALARAIYSRQKVAIIDDMLSGLDWMTEEFIWEGIFGPRGIFRQHGITVILATHKVRHLPEADNIVVLGEDGRIMEQGNFELLNTKQGYVQSLIVEDQAEKSHSNAGSETTKESKTEVTEKVDTSASDLLRKTGDITLYKYYLKSVGLKDGMTILAITFISQFCQYFPQLWVKLWTEADVKQPGDRTGMFYGIYLMLGLVGLAFLYSCIYYAFIVVTPKSGVYLHQKLLDVIMGAPLSFFVTTDTGVTVNRFSQDMSLIDMNLATGAFLTLMSLISCVMGAILIVISLKYMAAVVPFAIAFLYCLQLFYLRTSRQLRFMDLEAKSPLYTHLLETVQGISTIRAFGWAPATLAAGLEFLDVSQRPFYLLVSIQQWLQLVLDLFVSGLAVLFVGIAVSTTSSSAGSIGLALLNILTLNQSLIMIVFVWTELETSLGAISRLREMEKTTLVEAKDCEVLIPEKTWPQSGKVTLENITASYNADSEPVLCNISFEVEAGHKVAICGRTGSGKSSLLLALFRLLDLDSGDIAIDSLSTTTMPRTILREHLNIVPQDPVIFPGSVRLNVDPSSSSTKDDETDAAIIAALTTVALWSVISSRGGLDVDMSDIPLSQGQKQLFCLARAILRSKSSPILVIDEATSNVDRHTDELMQRVIREEWKGKTIIAVVHKLDTVLDFDRVAVLEKGSLVEFDAPSVLLEKEGGVFKGLWDSQR